VNSNQQKNNPDGEFSITFARVIKLVVLAIVFVFILFAAAYAAINLDKQYFDFPGPVLFDSGKGGNIYRWDLIWFTFVIIAIGIVYLIVRKLEHRKK
jgi:hypothetical protein